MDFAKAFDTALFFHPIMKPILAFQSNETTILLHLPRLRVAAQLPPRVYDQRGMSAHTGVHQPALRGPVRQRMRL